MSRISDDTKVSVSEGKYTVVIADQGGLHALRYGEPWQDLTGNKLVYCLASELDDTRAEIARLAEERNKRTTHAVLLQNAELAFVKEQLTRAEARLAAATTVTDEDVRRLIRSFNDRHDPISFENARAALTAFVEHKKEIKDV